MANQLKNKEQEYFSRNPTGMSDGNVGYLLMSSDNTTAYHLTPNPVNTWTCTCAGYSFRQDCKHRRYLIWLAASRKQARIEALGAERLELVAVAQNRLATIETRFDSHLTLDRETSFQLHNEYAYLYNWLTRNGQSVNVASVTEKAVA